MFDSWKAMRCLICTHKVSKKEKKYIKAAQQRGVALMEICTGCVISRNRVMAKMKGRGR